MKSFDYDACIYDGDVYCNECLPVDAKEEDIFPIFADSEWDSYPVCAECEYEHDYVHPTEEFSKRKFLDVLNEFKSRKIDIYLPPDFFPDRLDLVEYESGEWRLYFQWNPTQGFSDDQFDDGRLADLIEDLSCLNFKPKTKKVWFIHKSSRVGYCPYNGPSLKRAGLESKFYDSEEEARKDALVLDEYNPIGFSVSWKKVYV